MNLRQFWTCVAIIGIAVLGATVHAGRSQMSAQASALRGEVKIQGVPPRRRVLAGPAGPILLDDIVVDADGRPRWAFVWVKAGVRGAYQAPKASVLLDQKDFMFAPHVIGVHCGQEILVRNSDAALHNVHAVPLMNREFNLGQPIQGAEDRRVFNMQEVMVCIKCDCHPWMRAWAGVVAHPFFAVTDAAGNYEISDLPPGRYTVEVWHERYKSVEREIEFKGSGTLDFILKDRRE